MILTDKQVRIKDIMLDPLNPRFLESYPDIQSALMKKLLNRLPAKELTNSMNKGIKWMNRIVVAKTESLSKMKKEIIPEINDYKYIVIEGNNRLACLKSGNVRPENEIISEETEIPVIIASKELNEDISHFEMELKVIQGIANVMVVKEWETIPKAKHLYNVYLEKLKLNPNPKMRQTIDEIAKEMGMKNSKVRESLIRYTFFKEVNQLSDVLTTDDWGYLEAFDNSSEIRSLFGMNKNSLDFEWNKNDDDDSAITEKQELLIRIPEIINSARKEYPNCKNFRDCFKKLYNRYKNLDDITYIINKIIDNNEVITWSSIEEQNEEYTSEQKCKNDLMKIYNLLESFYIGADWAINYKSDLINIKNKIEKYLKILES